MAILDPTTNEIVIRVVYDGPPEAGKTTSVRALATSFNQASHTPAENSAGRTQWFDWMEYVGGRFEGSQIRCQIVSVPGQRELGHRREVLLSTADVIVFVGDTTRERFDVSLDYLTELQRMRDTTAPVGIVFQANKRDVESALTMTDIRTRLGDSRWEVSLVESVASDGTGIREAFVFAVRLALDRVRELLSRGALREGRPGEVSPAELLARLRSTEITAELPPVAPAPSVEAALLEAATMEANAVDAALDTIVVDPLVETNRASIAATLLQEVLAQETAAQIAAPLDTAEEIAAREAAAWEAAASEALAAVGESTEAQPPVVEPPVAVAESTVTVAESVTVAEPPVAAAEPSVAAAEPSVAAAEPSVAAAALAEPSVTHAVPTSTVREISAPLPPIPPAPRPKLPLVVPPRPPDATVPSGAIWPPVEGRTILLEVSQLELVPRRHGTGDWSAGLGSGWRLVSKRDAVFESLDGGRAALVQWARLHAACMSVVSPHRCIVLAATGDGMWRLWQIVRAEESLRDLVERTSSDAETVIDSLCQTAQLLVQVNEKLAAAPCELSCNLDTVGVCDASGMYIGLMPEQQSEPTPRPPSSMLLATELGPMLQLDLAEMRGDLGRALQSKPKVSEDGILASLRKMLE
jgi:signal recognition particle receptor subunit beta